jgi:hypothetical protein
MLYVAVFSAEVLVPVLEMMLLFAPQTIVGPVIEPGVTTDATPSERHALVPHELLMARTWTLPVIEPDHEVVIMIVPEPVFIVIPDGKLHS